MNSRGLMRTMVWFPLVCACGGWPLASASAEDVVLEQRQTQAAADHLRHPAEEPPDYSHTAQALVAVHRERYAAMSQAELARQQSGVEARCRQLQRETDPIENEYRRQLTALRESGQFSATVFGAIAGKRQALLQKWKQAVAELAALPKHEGDPIIQAVLESYLQEVDDSKRLERELAALAVDDLLPDELAIRKAQELLRAAEREPRKEEATDGDSDAEKREHAETPEDGRTVRRQSKAKVAPAPDFSARQRSTVHCKRRPRCGFRVGPTR